MAYVKWFTSSSYPELTNEINEYAKYNDEEIVSISVIQGFCAMVLLKTKG